MTTETQLKVAAATQELLDRREIRRSLTAWARKIGFEPAHHHQVLINFLERVARGEINRLLVMMPPGSAKSRYGSIAFVSWYLAQECRYESVPANSILACSYSKDLVVGFGRTCRNHVDTFGNVLGYTLAPDSKAADEWEIIKADGKRGRYFCAGTGAGIAGHRATLGLIDDPIGTEEEANSKTHRNKLKDWYNNDFLPRLLPGAPVVLICNRRHEEDLAGYLLATEGSEWTVLKFPLLARGNDALGRPEVNMSDVDLMCDPLLSPSESDTIYETKVKPSLLWNNWFNKSIIKIAFKDALTAAGLYQQEPTAETGDVFKREWIQTYTPDMLPSDLSIYIGSDHAISEREKSDLTCLLPVGLDSKGNLWILPDIFWKVAGPEECVEAMLDLAERRQQRTWWAESGHITKGLKPYIQVRQRERGPYFYIEEVTSVHDKLTRAQASKALMSSHRIFWPSFAHWWSDALHELMAFTGSGNDKHDDLVDALSEVTQGINRMVMGKKPQPNPIEQKQIDVEANQKIWAEYAPAKITFGWVKKADKRARGEEKIQALDK